jgi:hypothetical protein
MVGRRKLLAGLTGAVCFLVIPSGRALAQTELMTDDEFWELIDVIKGSRWDDSTSDVTGLVTALAALPPDNIAAFYSVLGDKALALATREHYAAFSWFPGLADTFLYARLAVIANGQETYEMILSNPSRFPARSTNIWFEKLLYVCDDAYRLATGEDFPRPGSAKFEVMFK